MLPKGFRRVLGGVLIFTVAILLAVYVMIGVGAFSEGGAARAFTLKNSTRGFGVEMEDYRLLLTGSAWESLIASFFLRFLVADWRSDRHGHGLILQRGGIACARLVEVISTYVLSVPSVVIGAGFLLLVFGRIGLSNQGAWSLILLAMLIRNLTVCMLGAWPCAVSMARWGMCPVCWEPIP